jgi:multidrug efflux system outer membrane protein
MLNLRVHKWLMVLGVTVLLASCKAPTKVEKTLNSTTPESYIANGDSVNSADLSWREFFTDPYLIALIDTALANNQELNIIQQEIQISQNEVMARKGEYLPFLNLGAGAGVDKTARYTPLGANEATTDIEPGRAMPDPVPDFAIGAYANWEIDVWRKLRNAKQSAVNRYLSSVEGKNFMVTNLVADIANSYYELLALDNQLRIIEQNIEIQTDALRIVKLQKKSAQVTELAVRRFEAQVLNTRSLKFAISQQIIETENKINFLLGRFPQAVERSSERFGDLIPNQVFSGVPSDLLQNRPDLKQAELDLMAAKLDVKVAKANFYPRLDISSAIGLRAFNPTFLVKAPESMLYSLAADMAAPLINRKAIKATYFSANSKQIQAVYNYERTILTAYIEVYNQVSNIQNLESSYELKSEQVDALVESITISNNLFRSARADYMEVLLTQRDALEARFELIETRKQQLNAMVNIYQALGGGWN